MPNATYDTTNKLVKLDQIAPTGGQVAYDVREDIYSDAKDQWHTDLSLNKFTFPWTAIGGQPLPGGAVAPRIYFLLDPWQMEAYPADHQVTLSFNIFTELGGNLFKTLAGYDVEEVIINELASGDDRVQQILDILTSTTYDQRIRDALALNLTNGTTVEIGSIEHMADRIDKNTLPP